MPWSLAPGGEEQGRSPRQQTNWVKNLWAAPEGGRQREADHSSLSLRGESETVGGPQSLAQGLEGSHLAPETPDPGCWYRNKLTGDDRSWFSQKPKGWKADSKKDCQMRFCGIHFPKYGKPCLAKLNTIYSNHPHQAKEQHPPPQHGGQRLDPASCEPNIGKEIRPAPEGSGVSEGVSTASPWPFLSFSPSLECPGLCFWVYFLLGLAVSGDWGEVGREEGQERMALSA